MTRAVVIGGGIAGVSAAAELARRGAAVTLLEMEAQLAAHTTGRSAALYLPSYGTPLVRALTVSSGPDFDALASEHGAPLLSPRSVVYVVERGGEADLDAFCEGNDALRAISPAEAVSACPALRATWLGAAAVDDGGSDIDVAGLHQAYVRRLRGAGGEVARSEPATAVRRSGESWEVTTPARTIGCDVVVDAAGAWTDEVAVLADVAPVGLAPLRRTLFTCPVRWQSPIDRWPLVADAQWRFYFRPEAGQLLVSPADETPSPPCDAKPEEVDVARALEVVNGATTLDLRSVSASWAGLRTFAPDHDPVAGCRAGSPGFAWSAGQGGYGIQMAPALARLAAALALGDDVPSDLSAAGVTAAAVSPDRF